ncbi:hypothetical protein J3492_00135 [Psychrobacter sp. F1192]|uniref:Uncharacterized protein n=1 Tax=Psychrobacter coccoides TaxID=2818440 RepID=A0ABS3NK78_9GAMM|nr:hypothetical protein [Psychrobacter coccoides]MBO1529621.1 hypothetical protein [Psychrobacter coccoides]
MTTKMSYRSMTDAGLIDEGLDCDPDSLAYELAVTLDALPIHHGSVQLDDDSSCEDCDQLKNEVNYLAYEVSRLEDDLAELDIKTLIAGAKKARKAVKQAHDKVNYLFGLGD